MYSSKRSSKFSQSEGARITRKSLDPPWQNQHPCGKCKRIQCIPVIAFTSAACSRVCRNAVNAPAAFVPSHSVKVCLAASLPACLQRFHVYCFSASHKRKIINRENASQGNIILQVLVIKFRTH